MDDESNTSKEGEEEKEPPETPSNGSDTEAQTQAASEEELLNLISKDREATRILSELLRGREIASVYIDARSGGVFFGGEARITGDVVGRSQAKRVKGSARGSLVGVAAGRVLSDVLIKVRAVYVEPSQYTLAQQVLTEKHVLVLWGQAHWGKWTTALHMLSTRYNEDVFEIDPNIDLEKIRSSELLAKRGYVIDTLAPDKAEKLDTFVLNSLSRRLETQHSHLVLIVDSRTRLAKEALKSYLIIWNDVPDRVQLLEKHLELHLDDTDALGEAHKLSQSETVQQFFDAHLLPRDVDRLAELLAQVTHGKLELEEALTRFESRAKKQVETWFIEHERIEERTFMISLAVFNGASYQTVVEADEQLQALLRPSSAENEPAVLNPVFEITRSQRIEDACAHPVKGYEETEFGRSPVELITLNNPTFQPAILHYAWYEYDRLRRLLVEWLRNLGFHSRFDVRARAAAAVGELSKHDFSYIRGEVLLPWANHQDQRARSSAALALGIPAWEGKLAPQVLGILHHWSSLRNNWRLCWTAAAAYGGLVGLRFPDSALRDLHLIAQAEDSRLFNIISHSLTSLFQAGQLVPDYYLKVIEALVEWTDDQAAKIVALTGLLIFLDLALEAEVDAEPEGGTWPTLLWLAREDRAYQDRVVILWRRALNAKWARKNALEALRRWLLLVDDDARLYEAAEQIIVTLVNEGNERERKRVRFHLEKWKKESGSADKILLSLNRQLER
ncbi:MAG: hypothetical protein MN733_09540 [Nitrososphaera sp.]|nr:hypothetical protein [Nitrososphaera sp.]